MATVLRSVGEPGMVVRPARPAPAGMLSCRRRSIPNGTDAALWPRPVSDSIIRDPPNSSARRHRTFAPVRGKRRIGYCVHPVVTTEATGNCAVGVHQCPAVHYSESGAARRDRTRKRTTAPGNLAVGSRLCDGEFAGGYRNDIGRGVAGVWRLASPASRHSGNQRSRLCQGNWSTSAGPRRTPEQYNAALIGDVLLRRFEHIPHVHARGVAISTRMYLRFLTSSGACPPELAGAVPTPRRRRLASPPRYIPADDIERVIAACDTATPAGIRDRAILLLLVRLALRAGGVTGLRLDDTVTLVPVFDAPATYMSGCS